MSTLAGDPVARFNARMAAEREKAAAAPVRYFAPCARGLEYLLVDELIALGALEAKAAQSGVSFTGDAALGYRACLWSRLASRILMPLGEFDADTADQLYDGMLQIDWDRHLEPEGTLAIDAHGRTRGLVNAPFAAQRAKDAIVDQFRARHGTRPGIDTERPSVRLNLALRHGKAIVSLDLSGDTLILRGWRRGQGEAPLKENVAAAILLRGRWPQVYADGGSLLDPMCGAGTLLIEGALMAAGVAPALERAWFGFMGWRQFDAASWQAMHDDARARAAAGLKSLRAAFFGADVNAAVLGATKQNAHAAGVSGFVRLMHVPVAKLDVPEGAAPGLVVANPPYGERLGEVESLKATYGELGAALKRRYGGWRAAVITNEESLARAIGLRAERKYQLMNGAIECTLYCYDGITAGEWVSPDARPLPASADAVKNRIAKNLKNLDKKLERDGVSCFRVYDADLPEYAAAIDVYTERATGVRWLHLQEYQAPKEIPPAKAERHLDELSRVASEVLAVPRERIAVKTRRPQSRTERYGRQDQRGEFLEVAEGGLAFRVNLFDYLDTGLFLDHRPTRAKLRASARGKRFLNLFCYTATATVYAADGGAAASTSVDLSQRYLEWADANLVLNGHDGVEHRLVQADVLAWLEAERGTYDLVFVDPPTFSNSKRAEDFDVQRDHVRLLAACRRVLAADGLVVFSNNFRKFRLEREAVEAMGYAVRDVSRASVPVDFARDLKIHQCWELRATPPAVVEAP